MSDTPDLSKVVSLIMENPALIEQISALVKKNDGAESSAEIPEKSEQTSTAESEPAVAIQNPIKRDEKSERRAKLLSAMRPYLSGERAKALDTMMSLSDILGVVRR